eukprot:9140314-Pyramimonas_sp.AAC.1
MLDSDAVTGKAVRRQSAHYFVCYDAPCVAEGEDADGSSDARRFGQALLGCEQRTICHRLCVAVGADWIKYYESIPLLELRHKFLRHGAPTSWLKLVFNMWRRPRVIRLGRNHATAPLIARYGLPAGGGYSDLAMKVHAVDALDIFVQRAPTVDFQNYIDGT